MKQYKFQALVTMHEGDGNPCEKLGSAPRRIVVRAHDDESNRHELYNALVSCEDEGPIRPGSAQAMATLWVAGEDIPRYLTVGSQFDLWLGGEVGQGVITRRLLI